MVEVSTNRSNSGSSNAPDVHQQHIAVTSALAVLDEPASTTSNASNGNLDAEKKEKEQFLMFTRVLMK